MVASKRIISASVICWRLVAFTSLTEAGTSRVPSAVWTLCSASVSSPERLSWVMSEAVPPDRISVSRATREPFSVTCPPSESRKVAVTGEVSASVVRTRPSPVAVMVISGVRNSTLVPSSGCS